MFAPSGRRSLNTQHEISNEKQQAANATPEITIHLTADEHICVIYSIAVITDVGIVVVATPTSDILIAAARSLISRVIDSNIIRNLNSIGSRHSRH